MSINRTTYQFPFTHYPAVRLVLLCIAGILIAEFTGISWIAALSVTLSVFAAALTLEWIKRKTLRTEAGTLAVLMYLLFILCLGMSVTSLQESRSGMSMVEEKLPAVFGADTLRWHGRVTEASLSAGGTMAVFITADSVKTPSGRLITTQRINTQIRYFRADSATAAAFQPGDYIVASGVPSEVPQRRNPHDFDVRSWLAGMGIFVQAVGHGTPEITQKAGPFHWGWWRTRVREGINRVFSEQQAPLAQAILIGQRTGLDTELRQDFSRAGIAHLMAVSGMHVGFVLIPLWFVIPYFWKMRGGSVAGLLLICITLFLYAGITGFSPSVQRASVFALFIAIARLFRYRRDPVNLTGLAALLILLVDPSSLFQIGFQMSFGAVLTIFVMLPVLERLFSQEHRRRWYARVIQLTVLSLFIQFALMPILIHRFHEFSLIGPFMNTIAAPITQLLFILGFAGVFTGMMYEQAGILLTLPADYLTMLLARLTTWSASLPGAYIEARLGSLWMYPFWVSLFGFFACLFNPALRFKALILCGIIGIVWQIDGVRNQHTQEHLQLTFFDVGQGDAVLIQTAEGRNYLYDTGMWSPFGNSGERFILPHLRAEGIRKLDGIFLSHPHADHIGGLLPILENVEVDVIYDPGFEYHSAIFAGYRAAAGRKEIPVVIPSPGEVIWLDERTPAYVLGPLPGLSSSNPNEHSLVIQIHYGRQRVLLTGDAEQQAETLLARQYGELLKSDLYKAGHHGSRTSSHDFFLEYVQPRKTVVSNALNNRYNHPHPEAARRILQHSDRERLFYTALDGAQIFRLDGAEIEYVNWRDK